MPTLMEDEEFAENVEAYRAELSLGVPDAGKAGNIMAILCDNAYRRIKDDTCPAHIRLNISVQSALVHPYACQSSPSTSG